MDLLQNDIFVDKSGKGICCERRKAVRSDKFMIYFFIIFNFFNKL